MYVETWNDVTQMLRNLALRVNGLADDTASLAGNPPREDVTSMLKSVDHVVIGLLALAHVIGFASPAAIEPWRMCTLKSERVCIRRNTIDGGWDVARCASVGDADAAFDGWRCDDNFALREMRLVDVATAPCDAPAP